MKKSKIKTKFDIFKSFRRVWDVNPITRIKQDDTKNINKIRQDGKNIINREREE